MKLDRNMNERGIGKYALLKLRTLTEMESGDAYSPSLPPEIDAAIKTLAKAGLIEWGEQGGENEFFVLKLKDRYAKAALRGYFDAVENDEDGDMEYAAEIDEMQMRAGPDSPWCKKPD